MAQASVDLVTGGSDLPVTTGNRTECQCTRNAHHSLISRESSHRSRVIADIDAVVERRLFGSIEEQTAAFLTGLHTIVPNDIFRSLRGMIAPIELQVTTRAVVLTNPHQSILTNPSSPIPTNHHQPTWLPGGAPPWWLPGMFLREEACERRSWLLACRRSTSTIGRSTL